ncbi:hypothetical protein [Paucibacter soli]|uniref:hypothetical protein n=1 Tax=Paucibacter soli TaxID=3133433 RepID=UPI0030B1EFA3
MSSRAPALLWLLLCALVFSNTGVAVLEGLAMAGIALLWALFYAARLLRHLLLRRPGRLGARQSVRGWRSWCREPAALALGIALSYGGVFVQARLWLSEPALRDYVQAVRDGRVELAYEFSHPVRRVGLYQVSRTEMLPDGSVRLITGRAGLMDQAGLAYSAHGRPQRRGEDSYRPLHGPWWGWRESW